MSTPILTFFNNKGGVGKTTLIYHLAWILADQGWRITVADLDPQTNITAAFLDEDCLQEIWLNPQPGNSIYQCIKGLSSVGDITPPHLQRITSTLSLLPGDVALSRFEDTLSSEWPKSMDDNNLYRPFRILTAFWQVMQQAAQQTQSDLILVDIGPNLGAINRAVLLASDFVILPLGADLFSLQGLRNLGPTLRDWRKSWQKRLDNWQDSTDCQTHPDFALPTGRMEPLGYVCQQYGVRLDRPVRAYDQWVRKIPDVYQTDVLGQPPSNQNDLPDQPPHCLATIKHYRSLIPMAQEHRKPIFHLTSADGAIGSHANAVRDARKDFKELADKILDRMGGLYPPPCLT